MRLTLLLDRRYAPTEGTYLYIPGGADGAYVDWQPSCSIDDFWKAIAPDIESLNQACGACLGIGDVEFIEWDRCGALATWAERRISEGCLPVLSAFYSKIREFALRAVELKTGVDVEL